MTNEKYSYLAAPKDSICYSCRWWNWAIVPDISVWVDACEHEEDYWPGGGVLECPGFEKVKK